MWQSYSKPKVGCLRHEKRCISNLMGSDGYLQLLFIFTFLKFVFNKTLVNIPHVFCGGNVKALLVAFLRWTADQLVYILYWNARDSTVSKQNNTITHEQQVCIYITRYQLNQCYVKRCWLMAASLFVQSDTLWSVIKCHKQTLQTHFINLILTWSV